MHRGSLIFLTERGMDPRRPSLAGRVTTADHVWVPVSVGGSAWEVLEGLLDDNQQQADCYERDRDRLAEADDCAGDHECDHDQA